VGYYNHSAIYLAIVFGIALSLALAYGPRLGMTGRVLLHLIALTLAASVLLTGSRGGVATAALLALALVPIYFFRTGRRVVVPIACVVSVAALLFAAIPGSVKRTEAIAEPGQPPGQPLSYRKEIWSNGLIEWRQFPLFGVGMGNFGRRSWEDLQDWSKGQSWAIRPSAEPLALNAPHGHSLYINTLAERGLFGFGVLALVLLAWGKLLFVSVPAAASSPIEWAVFGSAFSGWFVSVTAGLVNTTLHHEHGILTTLLLGLWLGLRRTGVIDRSPPQR
jgi:O-antigen ligase